MCFSPVDLGVKRSFAVVFSLGGFFFLTHQGQEARKSLQKLEEEAEEDRSRT